jgi:hypothetical protein
MKKALPAVEVVAVAVHDLDQLREAGDRGAHGRRAGWGRVVIRAQSDPSG